MAAITKYAGLPDIDTATDIYETQDIPEISKADNDSDSSDGPHRLDSVTHKSRKTGRGKNAGDAVTTAEDAVDGSTLLPSKDRVRKVFGGRRERTRTRKGEESEYAYTARPHLPPISQRLAPRSTTQHLHQHRPTSAGTGTSTPSSSTSSEDSLDDDDVNYITARTASRRIKETPSARLRRLKWELAQLERELQSSQASKIDTATGAGEGEIDTQSTSTINLALANTNGTKEEKQSRTIRTKKAEPTTTDLLKQLTGLQNTAEGLDHAASAASTTGSMKKTTSAVVQMIVNKAQEGDLLKKKEEQEHKEETIEPVIRDDTHNVEVGGDRIAAELDRRLHLLEQRIGTGTVDDTFISQPIIQQLQKMETVISLLAQPAYLDSAGRKVKLLLADLGKASALASTSSGQIATTAMQHRRGISSTHQPGQLHGNQSGEPSRKLDMATPDDLEKLDTLYSLIPRIDPLIPIIPPLLTRLRSLASLHANASSFAQTIEQLESQTHEIAQREGELERVLQRVEEGLRTNAKGVERNWASLEGRVGDLVGRLEKLGAGRS